ncbi:coth protein-domain-containing protein [Pilobolus umbonatus]|nr:coth protein-domain-containing protein [Pilobolus umbonatus]
MLISLFLFFFLLLLKTKMKAYLLFVPVVIADTLFNVIHVPHMKMGVQIDKEVFALNNSQSLVYSATVSQKDSMPYRYVILNDMGDIVERETTDRAKSSVYEFYNRPHPIVPMILPPLDSDVLDVNKERQEVHPYDEIPTFHIEAIPSQFKSLTDGILEELIINATITRISSTQVDVFPHAQLALSGQTSRLFKKLSYSIFLGNGQGLNGFQRFKLRSCISDPTYIREKLYYDILASAQVPTARASYARVFLNGVPQGLYLLVDHYRHPFPSHALPEGGGSLFQGNMEANPLSQGILKQGASLAYLGPTVDDYYEQGKTAYRVQELAPEQTGINEIVSLIQFIHNAHTLPEEDQVREWNKRFNVPVYLKHAMFEIIMGHADGYLGAAHNYMLYQDSSKQFTWLASDLDQTQGNTLQYTRPGNTTFHSLDRYGLLDNTSLRPLIGELLKVPLFQANFFQLFRAIYNSLLKDNHLIDYIFHLKNMIKEDVEWDQSLVPKRVDHFMNKQALFEKQLYRKVLQMPLGYDFYNRIDKVNFEQSVNGSLPYPSLMSLVDWWKQTTDLLKNIIEAPE